MIKGPEKRDGERKPFNSQVHFRLSADNSKQKTPVQYVGRGVDISEYGLGLISEVHLERGDILQVLLPVSSDTTLPVFAEVRWFMPFNPFRVGLQFLG
ncbi:MAG TPA: PilZ domain-containing protein [Candidatus Brocadiaceae bacterium]